jgi:hypothetical protein
MNAEMILQLDQYVLSIYGLVKLWNRPVDKSRAVEVDDAVEAMVECWESIDNEVRTPMLLAAHQTIKRCALEFKLYESSPEILYVLTIREWYAWKMSLITSDVLIKRIIGKLYNTIKYGAQEANNVLQIQQQ